jgi:carboxyl-terminal processing protease
VQKKSVEVAVNEKAALKSPVADKYKHSDFRRIASITAKLLDRNHYSGVAMDKKLSNRIFDLYFDTLDPMHLFFTDADVASFASYRDNIGKMLQYGEYDFAFKVYDVYRKRYVQYRKFTEEMLTKKIDFTVDEEIELNSEENKRPSDENAMKELWRKQIKNELLSFRLSERIEAEEAKKLKKAPEKKSVAKKTAEQRILQRRRDLGNVIEKRERVDILGLLLDSMARAYGAHSDYQAPKISEDFEINMSLSLSGIGATLTSEDGYIKIVELVPGGPAEQSGKLKVNDRIVSVTQENGETTDLVDMPVSQAVQFIRGEKGTKVTLEILSENAPAAQKIEIVRDKVNLTAGAAKGDIKEVNAVKVGVITLPSFYMDFDAAMRGDVNGRRASKDVQNILEDFRKNGVESVVIDLRGNGGGSLPDAVTLSGLFMAGGPVVQVRGKNSLSVERDPSDGVSWNGPLVILTSKLSASAAEIFTGALADAKRAVVVGDSRTFGKGTVLRVESLDRRYNSWFGEKLPFGSVTFEIAMFFRPAGSSVQQLGIVPDIKLPSLTEEMKVGEIFLNNHLPWDSIAPVKKLPIWDEKLDEKIVVLRKKSAERIAKNTHYQALIQQIEQYRKVRDRKKVSLNENVRYAQYLKEKEITAEAERLLAEPDNKKQSGDVVLNEAVNIAADLSACGK